jgi:hypothetical protein
LVSGAVQPLRPAGILQPWQPAGYRDRAVYIAASSHVPLFGLLREEPQVRVRAVPGHFVFALIHSYNNGNGRIGRFLMDMMPASGGCPWTVARLEHRVSRVAALVNQDIEPFARFIAGEVSTNPRIDMHAELFGKCIFRVIYMQTMKSCNPIINPRGTHRMASRPAAFFLFLGLSTGLLAQSGTEYPFPGTYKGKSAQGMAIHGDNVFLLNNGGHCRVYDLKSKKMLVEFDLASADEPSLNHANCANFGVEYPRGNDLFPALYVSQYWEPGLCSVESITPTGPLAVQTLRLKIKGTSNRVDWFVDKERKNICILTRISKEAIDDKGSKSYLIARLPLPPLPPAGKKSVTFTEKDIIDKFEITFHNLLQGGTARDGLIYLPTGNRAKAPDSKDKDRALIIVDVSERKISRTIDLNDTIWKEPEDVDFYNGTLLLYCGQSGGLYPIYKLP